jgi:hypothetical protein
MEFESNKAGSHPPDGFGPRRHCTFQSAGWSCDSTGFLWFSGVRGAAQYDYPCPRCNTELFLAKAQKRAGRNALRLQCPCCGPGVAEEAYQSALDVVEAQRLYCAD